MLDSLQLVEPKAIYRQIGDHVRELIVTGKLASGARLPSTEEMAAMWRTTPKTIQNALTPLVKEGCLTRVPKRGTFVRPRDGKLTCVGLYYAYDVWSRPDAGFWRSVHECLQEQCMAAGIRTHMFLDPRRSEDQRAPWAQLAQAAQRREFQGLIVAGGVDWPHLRWLDKLPVASAYLTSGNLPNTVNVDLRQFVELGLRHLRQQGCRSVGLITGPSSKEIHPDGSRHPWMDMFEHYVDTARDLGMETRNEWICASEDPTKPVAGSQELGYRRFQRLWRQKRRPQGLLVLPDCIAVGVIMALLKNRVDVPGELRLVFEKNERVEFYCPMPAAFAVVSEREIANALIQQIQKQFRGESCEPILLKHRLRVHSLSRET